MYLCVEEASESKKHIFVLPRTPWQPAGATSLETGLSKSGSLHSAHDTQGGVGMKSALCRISRFYDDQRLLQIADRPGSCPWLYWRKLTFWGVGKNSTFKLI